MSPYASLSYGQRWVSAAYSRAPIASVSARWGPSDVMPRRAAFTARPRMRYWPDELRSTAPGVSRRWARPSRCAAAMAWETWLTSWYASWASIGPALSRAVSSVASGSHSWTT
ncbi:hypothetical protein ACFU5Z_30580 [Streptomyces sp. NPDC057521]|uniref:hypothetical protein n=1 Tax=Streptomyces sp. NPDC057521 TaxID=3346156 RepID=UPI003675FDE5